MLREVGDSESELEWSNDALLLILDKKRPYTLTNAQNVRKESFKHDNLNFSSTIEHTQISYFPHEQPHLPAIFHTFRHLAHSTTGQPILT